jgi:DNA-directed RNA polymerase specialized sigma24 family protein
MKTVYIKLPDGKIVQAQLNDEQHESLKEVQRPYWREEKRKKRHGLSLERFIEENDFEMADDLQNPETLIDSFADEMQTVLRLEKLQVGLKMLTDKQASAIHKHFFIGMSYAEIADEEQVDKSTIAERIESAIKKLKKLF